LLSVEQTAVVDLFEIARSGFGDTRRLYLDDKLVAALAAALRSERQHGAALWTAPHQGLASFLQPAFQ
jgi:hypothetical protein